MFLISFLVSYHFIKYQYKLSILYLTIVVLFLAFNKVSYIE